MRHQSVLRAHLVLPFLWVLGSSCGRYGYDPLPSATGISGAGARSSTVGRAGSAATGLESLAGAVTFDPDAGAGVGNDAPVSGYCLEIPALAAVPTLDGVIDPGLELQSVVPVGWRGIGSVPAGHSMSYAAAWRPKGLYFFIHVTDPDRNPADLDRPSWAGDGAEIYVDSDASFPPALSWDDPGARQFSVAAPRDDSTPSVRAQRWVLSTGGDAWSTAQFTCVPTAAGYDLEAFVVAEDLNLPAWSLASGSRVGFDLAQNVSVPPGMVGTEGNRDAQYFLRIHPPLAAFPDGKYPFVNENAFCTATLLPP